MARALKLGPTNASVLFGAAQLATSLGRREAAIELNRRALEQDPLSAAIYSSLGNLFHDLGRFAEAEAAYRKALELAPQRTPTRAALSLTLLALGRREEALAEAAQEVEDWARHWALAIIHHAMGRPTESDAALKELIEKRAGDSAFQIAEVCAVRGEIDEAFGWLERASAQMDGGLADLKNSANLGSLRGDPRWGSLLRKMGLED